MNSKVTIRSLMLCVLACSTCTADDRTEFFESKIRPVLFERCFTCHSATAKSKNVLKGGLLLDSRKAILSGGESGPALVPGKPDESLLISAIKHESLEMPPNTVLKSDVVRDFEQWIRDGAVFPAKSSQIANSKHWSLLPISEPDIPELANDDWSRTNIDRFILRRLRESSLPPNATASKQRLIRRLTFDLTGLPPSKAEVEAFLDDTSPLAWERLVDRLLNSKRYGERWARHWLDVVRYADTTANDGNFVMRHAYRYRDYVIEAFNNDLPFNQFILEQLAGDLLPAENPVDGLRQKIATGFLMLGPKGLAETDKEQLRLDMADEQIDVTTRAFLGMSFSCARCHDHKFDPIPTTDYYALAGIFRGIEMLGGQSGPTSMWNETTVNVVTPELKAERSKVQTALRAQTKKLDDLLSARDEKQSKWESVVLEAINAGDFSSLALGPSLTDGLVAYYSSDQVVTNDAGRVLRWDNLMAAEDDESLDLKSKTDHEPILIADAIGGRPALRFEENKHVLMSDGPLAITGQQPFTFVMALNPTSAEHVRTQVASFGDPTKPRAGILYEIDKLDGGGPRLDFASGHSYDVFAENIELGKPQIWISRYHGGKLLESKVNVSGSQRETSSAEMTKGITPDLIADNVIVGGYSHPESRSNVSPSMDVAAILIFNRAITDAEVAYVGNYLHHTFKISANYGPWVKEMLETPPVDRDPNLARQLRKVFLDSTNQTEHLTLLSQQRVLEQQLASLDSDGEKVGIMIPKESGATDLQVHVRGNRFSLGETVKRRMPSLFTGQASESIETDQSGRIELAQWITSNDNSLTARVMVNRIWQWHFGHGIVNSSDNFGQVGEAPSHPELLDYLASRFIEDGWSIKTLHRQILTSQVYMQDSVVSSDTIESTNEIDPENRLYWKYPRRRIEAEAIRDSLLATSGTLDDSYLGGGELVMELFTKGDSVDRNLGLVSAANVYEVESFAVPRRTIYLPVIRNGQNEIIATFDAADANAVTTKRTESIVATQASYMLNSPFVTDLAMKFANRLLEDKSLATHRERIAQAYWIALGRPASDGELATAASFVDDYKSMLPSAEDQVTPQAKALAAYCQILYCLNEFIYVD